MIPDPHALQIRDAIVDRLRNPPFEGPVGYAQGFGIGTSVRVYDSSGFIVGRRVRWDGGPAYQTIVSKTATHVRLDASIAWSDLMPAEQAVRAAHRVLDYDRPTRDVETFPEQHVIGVTKAEATDAGRVPLGTTHAFGLYAVRTLTKDTAAKRADRAAVELGGQTESEIAARADPAPTFLGLDFVRGVFVVRNRLAYRGLELRRNNAALLQAVVVDYRHDAAEVA